MLKYLTSIINLFFLSTVSSRIAATLEFAVVHVRILPVHTRPVYYRQRVHTDRDCRGSAPSHTQPVFVSIILYLFVDDSFENSFKNCFLFRSRVYNIEIASRGR